MKHILIISFWITCFLVSAINISATPLQESIESQLKQSSGKEVIKGKNGWFFLADELRHVAHGNFWSENEKRKGINPRDAIIAYKNALSKQGITLYLMPVPPKVLIYPDKLDSSLDIQKTEADTALYEKFYQELEKEGIHIIDLLPQLRKERNGALLYCKTDTHFSGEGMLLFAQAATDIIKNQEWYKNEGKEFFRKDLNVTIRGDLIRMLEQKEPEETLSLQIIVDKDEKPLEPNKESPILLLGDSHTLVYTIGGDMFAKGAGLFDHISAMLGGYSIDLLGVRGSGATSARINLFQKIRKDKEWLKKKKIVIWCFTTRDLSLAKWKEIPVLK